MEFRKHSCRPDLVPTVDARPLRSLAVAEDVHRQSAREAAVIFEVDGVDEVQHRLTSEGRLLDYCFAHMAAIEHHEWKPVGHHFALRLLAEEASGYESTDPPAVQA